MFECFTSVSSNLDINYTYLKNKTKKLQDEIEKIKLNVIIVYLYLYFSTFPKALDAVECVVSLVSHNQFQSTGLLSYIHPLFS